MVGTSAFHLMKNSKCSPNKTVQSFRAKNTFCDVTLISDDGVSFQAHKVILASQSEKLKTILSEFESSQFCLFLAGLASQELSSLLAFIYSGEARVSQTQLVKFLAAAQTLQVDGLLGNEEVTEDEEVNEEENDDNVKEEAYEVDFEPDSVEENNSMATKYKEKSSEESFKHVNIEDSFEAIENNIETSGTESKKDIKKEEIQLIEKAVAAFLSQKFPSIKKTSEHFGVDFRTLNNKIRKVLIRKKLTGFQEISDDGKEEEEEGQEEEDDVDSVSFEFIKSGKSKRHGILTTHDRSFKYHFNKTGGGLNDTVEFYYCSEKKTGCQARAVLQHKEIIDEEGRLSQFRLVAVSKPQVHARNHQSENSTIIAISLVALMKREIAKNPSVPISQVKKKVITTELLGKISDQAKIDEVLKAFPKNVEKVLNYYKESLIGRDKNKKRKRKPINTRLLLSQ